MKKTIIIFLLVATSLFADQKKVRDKLDEIQMADFPAFTLVMALGKPDAMIIDGVFVNFIFNETHRWEETFYLQARIYGTQIISYVLIFKKRETI